MITTRILLAEDETALGTIIDLATKLLYILRMKRKDGVSNY